MKARIHGLATVFLWNAIGIPAAFVFLAFLSTAGSAESPMEDPALIGCKVVVVSSVKTGRKQIMRSPWIISAMEFLWNSIGAPKGVSRFAGAFAAVIAIGLAPPAFAQGVDQNTKQQIDKIIAAYHEAWNSHNAAGIAALYTKDGIAVTGVATPQGGTYYPKVVKNGTQEIEQNYEGLFKTGTVHDSATADQILPLGNGEVMTVGQYHLTGQGQSGPTKLDGYWTAVYVNDGGTLKIRLLTAVPNPPPPTSAAR
jgi:ketosteroid isomerase-like protein